MSDLKNAIDYLLNKSSSLKSELEVMGVHRKNTAISFQERKMDQFSFSETRQVGVRVIDGSNEGVAYSESLEPTSLDEMLAEATANSKMIKKEWPSKLNKGLNLPKMDAIYNPELENVPIEEKIRLASEFEVAALDFDKRITSVPYTRYTDASAEFWLANSSGLNGHYKANSVGGYTYCLAKDGELGVMGGEHDMQRSFNKINAKEIARKAAERTISRLGATRPATGRYTVVVENRVAEALIGLMGNYFSAKAVDEKTSPLANKLGSKIFSDQLSIVDDPFTLQGAASRPFDDEGFPSQKTVLIEKGVLRSYLTDSSLSEKLKLPHTASASRSPSTDLDVSSTNLVVQPGSQSLEQLLKSNNKVILLTNPLGFAGVRYTSGDFSIPMEGYMYENGQRVGALKDFLISGNLLQLFSNVAGVGNDILAPLGTIICPSLLIHDVNVAGQS